MGGKRHRRFLNGDGIGLEAVRDRVVLAEFFVPEAPVHPIAQHAPTAQHAVVQLFNPGGNFRAAAHAGLACCCDQSWR